MERSTVVIYRKGQEIHVDIRSVTQASLAAVLATSSTPTAFGENPTSEAQDATAIQQGITFLKALVVAGTVRVRANGRTYRLAMELDPSRDDVLTPEDLEEPGISGTDPFRNTMTLARAIAELSGMPELFRAAGEAEGVPAAGN